MDDGLQIDAFDLLGYPVGLFGLAQRSREAVEHISAIPDSPEDRPGEHFDYQLVWNKIAPSQVVGGDPTDFRVAGHFLAQQVPTREMGDAVVSGKPRRLSSFSRPRGGHQQETHRATLPPGRPTRDRRRYLRLHAE
jgi:hypothetical protein